MSGTISASNLSSVVSKYLQEYSKEVSDAVEATTETVAQKASDELKGAGTFKGRKYLFVDVRGASESRIYRCGGL